MLDADYETLLSLKLDFDDAMMIKAMLNGKANEIAADMGNKPKWRGADNQVAACGRLVRLRKLAANLDMLINEGLETPKGGVK
jgi:hypothetical protein